MIIRDLVKHGEIPKSVKEFYDNIGGVGNVYHIISMNENGEITQEKFGKNVFTNAGLIKRFDYYSSGSASSNSYYIFFGNGTSEPTLESTSMISQIISTSSKHNSIGMGNGSKYPAHYDPDKRTFSQTYSIQEDYLDYNVSDMNNTTLTQDVEITEIGVGPNATTLFSHSLVYDKNGNRSSIIKRPNEKLFVTIFWQGSVPIDLIESNIENGIMTFVEPFWLAYPCHRGSEAYSVGYMTRARYSNGIADSKYNYYRDYDSAGVHPKSINENNIALFGTMWTPNVLFEQNYQYISGSLAALSTGVFSRPSSWYNGTEWDSSNYNYYWNNSSSTRTYGFLHTFEQNEEPEDFEAFVFTDSWTSDYFNEAMGTMSWALQYSDPTSTDYKRNTRGQLPMVDMDIHGIYLYNHETKAWDLSEEFYNNPNYSYDDSLFQVNGCLLIESSPGSENGSEFSVVANPFWNTHKITKFNNSGITVYATDTYWDISSYEIIPNLSTIPDELSQKKYYCVASASYVSLHPSKVTSDGSGLHRLKNNARATIPNILKGKTSSGYNTTYGNLTKPLSSDAGGWLLTGITLIYPDTEGGPISYKITPPGSTTIVYYSERVLRWSTDDRIIIGTSNYVKDSGIYSWITFKVYDVSDPTKEPTSRTVTMPFDTKLNDPSESKSCIYSWDDSGILCAQRLPYNELCILNIYDLDNPIVIKNTKCGFILNKSHKVIYQCSDITNISRFAIYDIETQTIEDYFELPDDRKYTVNGIFGWKQHVYVKVTYDGISNTYYYNINTHVLKLLGNSWNAGSTNFSTYYRDRQYLSNDECFIGLNGSTSSDNRGESFMIAADNPEKIRSLHTSSTYSSEVFRYGYANGILSYIDNGKNLVLLLKTQYDGNYSYTVLFDIGYMIDTGEEQMRTPYSNHDNKAARREIGLYKGDIYYTTDNDDTSNTNLYFVSSSRLRPHKLVGSTRTITAINNPFRVSGKRFQLSITNKFDNILDYDPSDFNIIE